MVALAYTLYHRFCSQRRADDGPSPDSSSRSLNLSVVAVPDHGELLAFCLRLASIQPIQPGRSPPPYASTTALLLPPAGRPHSLPVFMVPLPSL